MKKRTKTKDYKPRRMKEGKGMLSAFTKAEAEMAQGISNDIAEFMDNGHSRQQLRMAVHYYASAACEALQKLAEVRSHAVCELLKLGLDLQKVGDAESEPSEATKSAPTCKCGKPCQHYGGVGGYSVACIECNTAKAANSRKSRARLKLLKA